MKLACKTTRLYLKTLIVCILFSILGCESLQFLPKKLNVDKQQNNRDGIINSNSQDKKNINHNHLLPPELDHAKNIPKPISITPSLPAPEPVKKEQTHTVIVSNVPVHELLFSLARDTQLNVDIAPDVTGNITINAVDQPLNALLDRIAENAGLVYEFKNNVLRIQLDKPYLKNYRVDYINMNRSSLSSASVSTLINGAGQGDDSDSDGGTNNSTTEVTNSSANTFWDTLRDNISAIIATQNTASTDSDRSETEGDNETESDDSSTTTVSDQSISSSSNSSPIIINKETGILSVRATKHQHEEIENFLNEVLFSSRRQVLIEATIAEVTLNDGYQAGIDWTYLDSQLSLSPASITQAVTDLSLFDRPNFRIDYTKTKNGDSIQTTLRALETFGDVSIMSSPKVMALNNQTALLKVVDNLVYFTLDVTIESSEAGGNDSNPIVTYETEVQTVPIGFVMSVTPYINDAEVVTLNVRPTISRVVGQVRDPNPALAEVNVISEVPIIQIREVESILKVGSGDIAVMGGLMQDEISDNNSGTPIISKLPYIGSLFKHQTKEMKKTELVIFIRPTVIKNASLTSELQDFRHYLPSNH